MDDHVLNQVTVAVNAILDPNTPHDRRLAAHNICESCRENEMSCLIGYALASGQNMDPHIKQFGLQLMQHFVKSQWVKAPQEVQMQTKNNAVELIKNCRSDESSYVKDGIAHVLAEIIKHVWPQQWPTMVEELLTIATNGVIQTELVELVFLRIAEDVAVLQNVSVSHRSQDIRQGLSLSMGDLMEFFMCVLERNSSKYVALLGTLNETELKELDIYHLLCTTTLKTLQGFLEWANTEHIFAKDGTRVQLLCNLLQVPGLRTLAADCLTLAVHRKGQACDRKRILVLTTPTYISEMASAILVSKATDKDQYLFFRRMGDLLSSLVSQLVSSWSPREAVVVDNETISNLASHSNFLDILLEFLRQSNPVIADTVTGAWNLMLQHCEIVKDKTLHQYVPVLLEVVAHKVQKCFDAELPVAAQLDFNDAEEIQVFLSIHKKNLLQIVRGCCCALPNECMRQTLQWLRGALSSEIDTGNDENGIKRENCNLKSPAFVHWDTIKSIADIAMKTGILHAKRQGIIGLTPVPEAESLLTDILLFQTPDVLLCRCQISFIGAFLPLLEVFGNKKQIVCHIIQTFAKLLRFSVTHPDHKLPLLAQFRRHVLSAIVHLCKYYPSFVILAYEDFKQNIGELLSYVRDLDKISLCESMVLVSGEWNDFGRQSALIGEAMSCAANMWIREGDSRLQTPKDFAKAIGLCSAGEDYSEEEAASFRGNISFCVALTLAMINRSRVPEGTDEQRVGGFLDPNGNLLHPCATHVLVVMENIATLVENFHALWTAPVMSVMHKDYMKSLNIRDSERRMMISFNPVSAKDPEDSMVKQPWERMQCFILIVLENCYQILGGVGKCCNIQLYGSPQLFPVLLKKAFSDMQTLPELRIRSFTRQFLYYFLKSCPEAYHRSVIAPILHRYCGFMNQILQERWNEFATKEQARLKLVDNGTERVENYDDIKEDDEILQQQLLRTVSREYLEMLVNLCVNKKPQSKGSTENNSDVSVTNASDMPEESMQMRFTQNISQLTPLGSTLLQTEIGESLLATALVALSWLDTATAFKGVQLTWPMLKHMYGSTPFISDDAAKFIFESILHGLQHHGQHDGCAAQMIALALFTYVSLRPTHDSLFETLKTIPRVSHSALETFDKGYSEFSEKKRKMNFKKLVSGVIEKHVGERFKYRQEMRRLPKFFQGRKAKSLDFDAESLGLEMFFKPDKSL